MRVVLYLFLAIIVLTLLRSVIGLLARGAADLFQPNQPEQQRRKGASTPTEGELKRDPVCGTYVSTQSPFRKLSGKETIYFCSEECRDKHRG